MNTIDVQISNIANDRNGNLVGRIVAWRDRIEIADSGLRRRQIHGGYREAARSWLASRGIATDGSGGGEYWRRENAKGRLVEVKLALREAD